MVLHSGNHIQVLLSLIKTMVHLSWFKANPNSHGTFRYESHRKFPTWNLQVMGTQLGRPMYFQPHPVKAMRFTAQQHHQVFNEGATAHTWWEHHDMINPTWRNIIQERVDAAA